MYSFLMCSISQVMLKIIDNSKNTSIQSLFNWLHKI